MAKRFDLDMGKRRARKRLRSFIQKRIYNRKEANVLCLPGEYGIEIEDVYRKLGFRDCNIVGVERDPKAAKAIQERYPNIYVHAGSLNEFALNYKGPPFDVVSLDYCGKASQSKLWPLLALAMFDHLSPRCVVHINVMAGRERKDLQDSLRMQYGKVLQDKNDMRGPTDLEDLEGILRQAGEEDLGKAREDAFTHMIMSVLGYIAPTMRACAKWGLKSPKGHIFALKLDTKIVEKNDNGIVLSNVKPVNPQDDLIQSSCMIKHEAIQQINKLLRDLGIIEYARREARSRHGRGVIPDRFLDYHLGRTLVMSWFDQEGTPNMPVSVERFSYVSESGRRMLTDLVETRRMDTVLKAIPSAVAPYEPKDDEDAHEFMLDPRPDAFDTLHDYLQLLRKIVYRYAKGIAQHVKTEPAYWPEREDLGGGTVTMTEEQVKEKVIGYIKRGRDNEYILRKFPTLKKGSLAAIRAHVTMGTY